MTTQCPYFVVNYYKELYFVAHYEEIVLCCSALLQNTGLFVVNYHKLMYIITKFVYSISTTYSYFGFDYNSILIFCYHLLLNIHILLNITTTNQVFGNYVFENISIL
jgi:hypothetical protein